jgi:hypothetical protein
VKAEEEEEQEEEEEEEEEFVDHEVNITTWFMTAHVTAQGMGLASNVSLRKTTKT